MPCFHPREIIVNKGKVVYNWSKLSDGTVVRDKKPLAYASKYCIQVPCGKCAYCLALSQSQWSFRIEQEAMSARTVSALFVTLTYDNEHLPEDLSVSKKEVQKYLHDLRQNLYRKYFDGTSSESVPVLRYYVCAEYGSKRGRPHYHGILMFNKSVDWKLIQSSWNKGIVDIREFTSARAGYVAKYSVKQLDLDYVGRTRPFHLQSKGLGSCFLDGKTLKSLRYNMYYRNLSGRKVKLPRYYLDKLGTSRRYYVHTYAFGSFKRSVSSHSFSYERAVASAQFRYFENKQVQMSRLGFNDEYLYDEYLRSNHEHLEQILKARTFKDYYHEKSRIGY